LYCTLKNKKLLLITKKLESRHIGGRELLSMLNLRALSCLFEDSFFKFEVSGNTGSAFSKAIAAFRGRVDGLDNDAISQIVGLIQLRNINQVFIDGSNFGAAAKELKKHFPFLEVITFYHNVETRFFLGSLRRQRSIKSLAVLIANFLAERLATRYSDKIICLNARDSEVLHQYFLRRATHLFPMALDRPSSFSGDAIIQPSDEDYVLFVGGNFYANVDGIAWFRKFVSPSLDIPLYVVGRGLDQIRKRLELTGKIVIIGAVDNLEDWYTKAKFVVAPIFDGSGMKTKVAEALMYGKKIVGTPEAFVGYEAALPDVGWCCSSPEDFLVACKSASHEPTALANNNLVSIFEREYSYTAAKYRLSQILGVGKAGSRQ